MIFLKKLIIFTCIFLAFYMKAEFEYQSVHDETYWFPNEDFTLEGFQIGTVRSNLVWMDRMSVFVDEKDCKEMPKLMMTLSTSKVKKEFTSFDFTTLKDKFVELGFNYEGKLIEKHEAQVLNAFELQNKDHAVSLLFEEIPEAFLVPWNFVTIKILENDPHRKYFDLPERQYRMGGFPTVLTHLLDNCMQQLEN